MRQGAPVDLRPAARFFPATGSAQDVDVRPFQEPAEVGELVEASDRHSHFPANIVTVALPRREFHFLHGLIFERKMEPVVEGYHSDSFSGRSVAAPRQVCRCEFIATLSKELGNLHLMTPFPHFQIQRIHQREIEGAARYSVLEFVKMSHASMMGILETRVRPR